ncbi:TPA: hypothetical protein ACPVXW_000443 [Vibrio parahaemolyticus]
MSEDFIKAFIAKTLKAKGIKSTCSLKINWIKNGEKNNNINSKEKLSNYCDIVEEKINIAVFIASIIISERMLTQKEIEFLLIKTRELNYNKVMGSELPSPPFKNGVTLKKLYLLYKFNGYMTKELDEILYLCSIR